MGLSSGLSEGLNLHNSYFRLKVIRLRWWITSLMYLFLVLSSSACWILDIFHNQNVSFGFGRSKCPDRKLF